jgi:hypothetical protein
MLKKNKIEIMLRGTFNMSAKNKCNRVPVYSK